MNKRVYIGNDIVDFNTSLNKHLNLRFRQKVFSNEEQITIDNAKSPNELLWTFWAAKEAAYKALKKHDLNILFTPKKFQINCNKLNCESINNLIEVNYECYTLYIKWQYISLTCIHCIAILNDNGFENINYKAQVKKYHPYKDSQSIAVRLLANSLLVNDLKNLYKIKRNLINIGGRKELSPPYFYNVKNKNKISNIDLSLSHDGDYIAACLMFY